jgi:chemotaxis protein histidine kinase CheA
VWGNSVTSDLFAERFAAVRQRFVSKLEARIDEIEGTVPKLGRNGSPEVLARAHRRAHDLCGVGPTMGFVATGKAARAIEQLMLTALRADRLLTGDELGQLTEGLAALRAAATAETRSAGRE